MKRFTKYSALILCLGIMLVTTAASADVDGDIHKSFSVNKNGLLEVDAAIGSIEVRAGSGNVVDVEIRFEHRKGSKKKYQEILKDIDVEFDTRGDDVYVELKYHKKMNLWNSFSKYVKVYFLIKVPDEYNLDMKTSGGGIKVDDITGKVRTRTSGGSLKFGHITGPVDGRTSGGSIALESCEGLVDVHTSGGSISIGRVRGNVRAATSGGSIQVDEVYGAINASTSGGSVSAKISRQPEHDCSLKTSGGTVTVKLAEDIGMNLNAQTSGGRVHTEFPVTVRGTISKRSLRAKLNDGGPELYLRSSGGSIYIKEL